MASNDDMSSECWKENDLQKYGHGRIWNIASALAGGTEENRNEISMPWRRAKIWIIDILKTSQERY